MEPFSALRRGVLVATLCAVGTIGVLQAQTAPTKILVGFPPGGSADLSARLIAEKMTATLGTPVVVENRPGAGGRVAAQAVKDATDGNTLMLAPLAVMVVQPVVFKSVKYDTTKDFAPVGTVATFPLALAAGPESGAKTLAELIAWWKANPTKANFGSPATGSLPHFLGQMVAEKAGVKAQHVPYQGGAPLLQAILGGQISAGVDTPAEYAENHHAGKLRILGLTGNARHPNFSDVPTFKEQGVDIDAQGWFALYGPASMPAARAQALNAAMQTALKQPDVISKMAGVGLSAAPDSIADAVKRLADDKARWEPVIKSTGLQLD
jgi:tripartite-type tricarboxylate transporter receptor subunit TctC